MAITLAGAGTAVGISAITLQAIYLLFALQHHHTHVANNINSAIKVTCMDSHNRSLSQVVSPGEVVSMETSHDRLSYAVQIKTGNSFGKNAETAVFVADSDVSFIVEYKDGALNIMTSKYGKVWERDEVLRTINMQDIEHILKDVSNKLYVTVAALAIANTNNDQLPKGFSLENLGKMLPKGFALENLGKMLPKSFALENLGKMLEVVTKIFAAAG